MDERELREIEERAEKATGGPWMINRREWTDGEIPLVIRTIGRSGRTASAQIPFNGARGFDADRADNDAAFIAAARTDIPRLVGEVRRLQAWVGDLQSGLYVNCVYCGHQYGPRETTPVSMAAALKAHVEQCPKHPMAALRARVEELEQEVRDTRGLCVSANEPDRAIDREIEIRRLGARVVELQKELEEYR